MPSAADELLARQRALGRPLRFDDYLDVALSEPCGKPLHWVYVPEAKYPFYRVGCYSHFSPAMAQHANCLVAYRENPHTDGRESAVRAAFHISLPLINFSESDDELELTFAGPARRAQVFIDRDSGECQVTLEDRGMVGLLADLHKGAETGWAWRYLLDVVSVWIVLSSITGIIMLLAMPKRRALGLVFGVLGGLITIAAYAVYVPR